MPVSPVVTTFVAHAIPRSEANDTRETKACFME
jgi:hypothetical protein